MAIKLLLIEDVEDLGRSGDIVNVRPGYARNFLVPNQFGVPADKNALRMQARLQEERAKKAVIEKAEADKVASALEGVTLTAIVKVDHEGHMYGSVTAHDVLELLSKNHGIQLEKRSIVLQHPIKTTGSRSITIKLKEGVTATITLKVVTEEGLLAEEQPAT
jgi:large subunit ribosomal protein L9